jgi:hypothetical protein
MKHREQNGIFGEKRLKNQAISRDERQMTSFGTRGSQVQILPLRPEINFNKTIASKSA